MPHMETTNFFYSKKFRILLLLSLSVCLVLYLVISSWVSYKAEYNVTIAKIEVNAKGSASFYDRKGDKHTLGIYSIYLKASDVKVGDSIHKGPCEPFLYVYRKDGNGNLQIVHKQIPKSILPREWLCD